LPVLTATGHHNLAVRLLQNRRYPSWGFEVVNGATTIWERWNSYTKENGFVAGMNSFSHYSFGAVCEWMFQSLAGIDTNGAGYKCIILRPGPPSADSNPDHEPINWVNAEYDSIRGRIKIRWKKTARRLEYNVAIPANTTGILYLPADKASNVIESGMKLSRAEGVRIISEKDNLIEIELASGSYHFISKN